MVAVAGLAPYLHLGAGEADVPDLVLGAGVGTPRDVHPQRGVAAEGRALQQRHSGGGRGGDAEGADGRAGAGPHRRHMGLAQEVEAPVHQHLAHTDHVTDGHAAQHHVLVTAQVEGAVAVAVGHVGQQLEVGAGQVSHGHLDGEVGPPRIALGAHARRPAAGRYHLQDLHPVGVGQHLDRHRFGVGPGPGLGEGLLPGGAEAVVAELVHHVLEAALGRGVEVAVGHEHVDQGLGRGQGVGPGHEVGQLDGQVRCLAQAAATPQLVARLTVAHHGHEAAVVQEGVVAAARRAAEGEVDSTRQLAVERGRAGQDGVGDGPGVGQAVERLVEAGARLLRGHHVSHGVAACRAGAETQLGQLVQHLGHLAVLHPVQLHVLPGRQVQPVVAVGASQAGQSPCLVGGEHAARNADANHEHVVLLLSAHAVGLQGVALLRAQPGVTFCGQAGKID